MLSDGVYHVVVASFFILIDTLALVLRAVAKRRTKFRFGSDDGWILFALLLFYVWAGLVVTGAPIARI